MDRVAALRKQLEEAEAAQVKADAALPTNKRRAEEETLTASRGLKHASYYAQIASTEGMLRKRLRTIESNIKTMSFAGSYSTKFPSVVVDVESVKAALLEQGFSISPDIVPAVCVCGRGDGCELGRPECFPACRTISWGEARAEADKLDVVK